MCVFFCMPWLCVLVDRCGGAKFLEVGGGNCRVVRREEGCMRRSVVVPGVVGGCDLILVWFYYYGVNIVDFE
ncbi:hypothetical protein M758_UG306900 [Ceratodon purpureus]|nr:hypothetical protein M758_UG306900 [Ceratodon purpureus]